MRAVTENDRRDHRRHRDGHVSDVHAPTGRPAGWTRQHRLATGAWLALCCVAVGAPPAAFAQAAQLIEVTGSRILRPELTGNVPAIAVSPDMLGNLGFENLADMTTQLPQFAASFGVSRTQSTQSSPVSTGLNLVNLRNLGASRALVLINGRRTVGGTSTTTAVDFNTIPTANIERIDIITGGASAVYGSDAVAGVINIVTKKTFDGFEVGAGHGATQKGDNQNPTGHVMWGRNFGNAGRVLATLQVDRQGRVSCRDRELCAEDFSWTTPATPLRGASAYSTVGLGGRYFVGGTSYVRRNNSFVDANGRLMPFVQTIDGFAANAERDLAIPTQRTMGALEGEFALGPSVRAYGELNHGRSEITSHFESFPFQSQATNSLFGSLQATIPLDNPFIPAALRAAVIAFNASAPPAQRIAALTWSQRLDFGGARGATATRDTTRLVLGLNGDIKLFGNDWRWDTHHVQGRTDNSLHANGLISTANLYNGLRVEPDPAASTGWRCADAAARAAGCVPINPFADYSAEMQNALRVDAHSHGTGTLGNTVASLSGTLAELPAGSLRAAAGIEQRRISGYLDVATVTNQALATGTPIADTDKSALTTREAFVEALIPLLADRPGIRSLNLEAAFRRSQADRWGYSTWKLGGDWEPADGLRFRAMRARAVRAPEPRDLSGGGFGPPGLVNDPCTAARRTANPTRAANCDADGIPANYTPPTAVEAGVSGRFPANPDLVPEVATTLTLGLVWEPASLKGLAVALDRFKIDVQGIISSLSRQFEVDRCYDTVERQFCGLVARGAHPQVAGASYVLLRVDQRPENVAAQAIAGTDIDIRYRWSTGIGRFEAGALFTHYDKATLLANAVSAPLDLLGKAGGQPSGWIRTTGSVNLGGRFGGFRANWNLRYIGAADMAVGTTEQGFPRLGAMTYHNLRFGHAFTEGGEAFLGITNVGDRKPPVFASGSSGTPGLDTVPGYYDVFGRSFFVGAKMTFR